MSAEQPVTVPSTPYPNGSLYVGDLRQDVGESDIYDAFKECGTILSVRVCRDVKDQRSLGYAYVNFQNAENAQKALDTLNGKELKGKPCRVMWSRRDPSQRKSNEGNLFVKGLKLSVKLVELQDVFSHFGTIASCKVQTREDGVSLGYGFVQFEKPEDSVKALEACKNDQDHFKSLGEKLVVEKFVPKRMRASNANEIFTNLYVKNIGKKFTTEDLIKMFEVYGTITSPVIMTKENGESKGFGFVNFEKHEFAVKAKEGLDKRRYKWKDEALVGPLEEGEDEKELEKEGIKVLTLYVDRAQKKREREAAQRFERNLHNKPAAKTNLYIRNLADDVTDDDLRNLFRSHGEIKSVIVMKNENGISRGFGFCDFATPESASDAIQKVHLQIFHGKPLYVAHAMKKEERHAMLESQHQNPRQFYQPMGGMYRQVPMGSYPPNMYVMPMGGMSPNVYPFMRQPMFPRPSGYARPFHSRQGQRSRATNKQQGQPQMPAGAMQQPAMPIQQPQAQPAPRQPEPAPQAEPLDKQQIGEKIYTRIMGMFQDQNLWGKLTGMLLESIPLHELQGLLNNSVLLDEKINQAKDYYDKHMHDATSQ